MSQRFETWSIAGSDYQEWNNAAAVDSGGTSVCSTSSG